LIYLLDTNVISELRKPRPHGAVVAWRKATRLHQIVIPATVLAEAQAGVELTRKQNPTKARELDAWIDDLMSYYTILPADALIFREWARLMHRRSTDWAADAMVAASGRVMGMTVATRNVSHFTIFNVPIFNPFEYKENL